MTLSNEEIDFAFTFVAADIARAIGTEVHEDPAEIIVVLDEDVIAETVSKMTGIPLNRLDRRRPLRGAQYPASHDPEADTAVS